MAVLRESPWYLEIQQECEQRGELRGELRGRTEGERSLVLRQLVRRVGSLPANVGAQFQTLDLNQVEALGEALLDFTQLADLTDWLQENRE